MKEGYLENKGNFYEIIDAKARSDIDAIKLVYNVKKYGAVGDGTTDDRSSIQSAIDAVYALGGGTLYLPNGRYMLDNRLQWKPNVSLVGESIDAVLAIRGSNIQGFAAISWLDTDGNPLDGITYDNPYKNCHFRNFAIDGSELTIDSYTSYPKGINIHFMEYCSFENLYLHDIPATGLGVDFLNHCTIHAIHCVNCGKDYVYEQYETICGGAGIGIATNGMKEESFTITDCTCDGCGHYGIFVEGTPGQKSSTTDTNITIADNVCINGRKNGINVTSTSNVVVSGNVLRNNAWDGISINTSQLYTSDNVLLTNNICSENGGCGIRYAPDIACDEITIIGNKCSNNTKDGILCSKAGSNINVSGNDLYGNTRGFANANLDTFVNCYLWGNQMYNNTNTDKLVQGTFIDNSSTVTQLKNDLVQLDERVTTLEESGGSGGSSGGIDGSVSYQFEPENLFDASEAVGTMTINGSSVSGLSNWIPVKSGAMYTCTANYTQYYFFDSDKNYVSGTTQITSPVRFISAVDGYCLVKSSSCTFVRGSYLTYDSGVISRWNGKRWLAIGDSLTDIAVADKGYPYIVGSNLGMEVTNVGNSGKVMSYFHDLIPTYADDYDLITVLLGANNQGYNCSIGTLNDSYYASEEYTSNSSFYAQMQRTMDLLIDKYPSAIIAFLTPIRRSESASDGTYKVNALNLTTKPYADAVIDCCAEYGLAVLDLYTAGINPKWDTIRANYFVDGDGTHPNNEGHKKWTAPVISEFLNSIAPFGTATAIKTLSSISATYTGGDVDSGTKTSELSGLTVTATYSDSTTATVTGYTLSPSTVSEGSNTITVTYKSKTCTFTVTGTASEVTYTLASIALTLNATETDVDTNTSTLINTVIGTYSGSDGSTKTESITGYSISPDTIAEGSNSVTVSHNGITSNAVSVTGIATDVTLESISAVDNQTSYTVGTDASDLDLTVTATYSDSTTAVVTGWMASGTVAEGENTFTVEYGGKSCTVTVAGVESSESSATLIHAWDIASNTEILTDSSTIITDEVGTANLSVSGNYLITGTLTDPWGLSSGDSWSVVATNCYRKTIYSSQGWCLLFSGMALTNVIGSNGEKAYYRLSAIGTGNDKENSKVFGSPAYMSIGYYNGSATGLTVYEDTATIETNGTAHDIAMTYDSSTKILSVYKDGELSFTVNAMDAIDGNDFHIDGLTVANASSINTDKCGVGKVYIYNGVTDKLVGDDYN